MTSLYEPPVQTDNEPKDVGTTKYRFRVNRKKNPLYMAAGWMADKRLSKARDGQISDLVGSLLCHGARAWRMSQPTANIHLRSISPAGQQAIHLRVK